LFGPSRVLVGSDDGAIKIMDGPINLALGGGWRLHSRHELTPDTSLLPAVASPKNSKLRGKLIILER
jgi:hypothetical protein